MTCVALHMVYRIPLGVLTVSEFRKRFRDRIGIRIREKMCVIFKENIYKQNTKKTTIPKNDIDKDHLMSIVLYLKCRILWFAMTCLVVLPLDPSLQVV